MLILRQLLLKFLIAIGLLLLCSNLYSVVFKRNHNHINIQFTNIDTDSTADLISSVDETNKKLNQKNIGLDGLLSDNNTVDSVLKTSRVSRHDLETLESIHNLIWKQIESIQEDGDCESKKILICQNQGNYAGFGSMLHRYGACIQMAYGLNRLWFIDQPQYNHFNGFEGFLKPESKKCGYLKKKYRNSPSVRDIEDRKYYNGYELDNSHKVFKYYSKGKIPHPLHVPTTLPVEIEKALERYNVSQPWLWFTSQFLGYLLLRPNEDFQKKIDDFRKENKLTYPYAAMHVRRGDKVGREARAVDEAKYNEKMINYFDEIEDVKERSSSLFNNLDGIKKQSKRQIYVASDSKNMVDILKKKLPKNRTNNMYEFYKNPLPSPSASYFSSKFPKELMQNFLFDINLVSHANFSVVTFSSNMGRLIDELKQCIPPYKTDIGKTLITMDFPFVNIYLWQGLSNYWIRKFWITIESNHETKVINDHKLLQYDQYEKVEHEKDAPEIVLDNGKTVVLSWYSKKRVKGYIYKDHILKWPGKPKYPLFS